MAKFGKFEKLAAGTVAGLVVLTGACSAEGNKTPDHRATLPMPSTMYPQIPGIITHTENKGGKPVGVHTYTSPFSNEQRRTRGDGGRVNIVCVEPNGRNLVDTDVQPGLENRGHQWYLLTATPDPGQQEWVNTSYVKIIDTAGATAVQSCATIEGLNYPSN